MPTKVRKFLRNRNKAGFRKRRRGHRGWMAKPLGWYAHKAFQGVRFLKGLINVEKKYCDTSISGTPGSTPVIIGLNSLAQGSSDHSRTGDSILAKYLTIRTQIQKDPAATRDAFRVVYVLDKENRGAAPAWTDVFDGTTTYAKLNRDNMDRFVILKDHTYILDNGQKTMLNFKHTIPLNFHIKYAGNNGDTTDYRQNAIFQMSLGQENTNKTVRYSETRIAFYDN